MPLRHATPALVNLQIAKMHDRNKGKGPWRPGGKGGKEGEAGQLREFAFT